MVGGAGSGAPITTAAGSHPCDSRVHLGRPTPSRKFFLGALQRAELWVSLLLSTKVVKVGVLHATTTISTDAATCTADGLHHAPQVTRLSPAAASGTCHNLITRYHNISPCTHTPTHPTTQPPHRCRGTFSEGADASAHTPKCSATTSTSSSPRRHLPPHRHSPVRHRKVCTPSPPNLHRSHRPPPRTNVAPSAADLSHERCPLQMRSARSPQLLGPSSTVVRHLPRFARKLLRRVIV